MTEWQTDGWSDQLTYWLTDWLSAGLFAVLQFNWLTDCMTDWLNDWLETDQLTIQPTGLLTEQKMNKWIDGLMDEQADYLNIWVTVLNAYNSQALHEFWFYWHSNLPASL